MSDADVDVTAGGPPGDGGEPAGATPRDRPSPGLVAAVVLAVLFAALASILAFAGSGGDGEGDRNAVRRVAGQFGEALLTYDYDDLQSHRRGVLALATPSFEDEYDEAFADLRVVIAESRSRSSATVKDVFLSEIDEGTAEAILVADLQLEGAAGPRPVFDVYFKLELVEADGEWKIDDVVSLNFNLAPMSPSRPTTTAGAPTTTGG